MLHRIIFGAILKRPAYLACVVFLSLGSISTAAAVENTKASVYSKSLSGCKTASGHKYKPGEMTAASKHLPLGSQVQVTNKKTGKKACVTITDRGPFVKGRNLDLSSKAASKIGLKGVAPVSVKPLKIAHSKPGRKAH